MRKCIRPAAALALCSLTTLMAFGQPAPAPVTPPAEALPVRPTGIAATVNGQPINEVVVYRALRQFPPSNQESARKDIITHLVEQALVDQYLNALKITVENAELEKTLVELKKELTDQKKDLVKELAAMMLTEAEFQSEVVAQMKWEKFVNQQSTDAALKQLFETNPDIFEGTMVRARHILLVPGADPAKQQEAAQKLRSIKATVDAESAKAVAALPANADALAKESARQKKIEELFSAYAKEHSTCPSKDRGGDLSFFPRSGAMVEPFAKAAFEIKPYQMTDVVVTEFGYHLILVTERKPGSPKKFEEIKDEVKMLYAMRLREAVVAQMKPKAQITINPAPAPSGTPAPPVASPAPPMPRP